MDVIFKNKMGVTKKVKVGYSWTVLFFGGFPMLFRGMPMHGILLIMLGFMTFGLSSIIYSFMANKATAIYAMEHGYEPIKDAAWEYAKPKWGISEAMNESVVSHQSTPNIPNDSIKFCKSCGSQNKVDTKFCTNCGQDTSLSD